MKKALEALALMALIVGIVYAYFYYPLYLGGAIIFLTIYGVCYIIVTKQL